MLSDRELRAEVDAGNLVFDPPLEEVAFQSASIDLALHDVFYRPKVMSGPGIEVKVDVEDATAYQYFDTETTDEVVLQPGEFALGETKQAIGLPAHLAALIEGKSGRARHGLIVHCTAPHIAPGWGYPVPKRVTLELANLGKAPLRLRAGIGIAQLLVFQLSSTPEALYSGAQAQHGS